MALIKCIECKKMISDKAENCPHCGLSVASSIQYYYKEQIEKNEQADKEEYKESLEHSITNNLKNPKEIPMIYKIGFFVVIIVVVISIFSGEKNVDKKIQQETTEIVKETKKQQEKTGVVEETKTENVLETYNREKTQILSFITSNTKAGKFEIARDTCTKYMFDVDDEHLTNLCNKIYKRFDSEQLNLSASQIKEEDKRRQEKEKEKAKQKQEEEAELKASMSPKAWKLHKKYPHWSVDDCESVANKEIWIGMSYQMLKAIRGLPNSANPSNYGYGTQWQWCWHSYSPSCFYDHNDDGIIDSYN